ncbi:DNA-directed RNA polymerase subunit beta [Sutcliffiella deserti]|uniref:DNA-directed RNA polymerase subunit beta n=1 Tax=Sutcliffiella deserti TaxID=2875501 RepID=UPI001CBE8E3E|nr:DNA-directed RNA polymerase subunit beta [Sutcliffiella deserti]
MDQKETKTKSLTREELRKTQKNKAKEQHEETAQTRETKPKKQRLKWRIRLIPIWLRLIIILAIMIVAAVAGAMVGYGILGGGSPMDVFNRETWQHIIDLVQKD